MHLGNLLPAKLRERRPRLRLRYWRNAARDAVDVVLGRSRPMIPPRRLVYMVGGDFEEVGSAFVRYLTGPAGLRSTDRVLDVGCGVGRMAVPLTEYLSPEGSYEGFDVDPALVGWCERNITPRFPNFHFCVSDVYNRFYAPTGRILPSEYRFPYPDAAFDMVFLASVFTHMLPADLENYLSEVSRVLKPGGRCVITYFLLNEETERSIQEGRSKLDLRHQFDGYRAISASKPEDGLAYPEPTIRAVYERHHLRVHDPIDRGSWSGAEGRHGFQDIVIATKRG